MQIEITKIVCVSLKHGGDTTYLHTTLPCGTWPFEGNSILKLDLARGTAQKYCEENFPSVPFSIKYV